MPGHRHDPRHRVAALGNEHFLTFAYASEPAAQIRAQLTDSHFNRHCRYIRQHECSDIAPRRPQALLRLLEIREAGAQGGRRPLLLSEEPLDLTQGGVQVPLGGGRLGRLPLRR